MKKLIGVSAGIILLACSPAKGPQNAADPAVDSLLLSAERGDAVAQLRLGLCLDRDGRFEEAARWYERAAQQGESRAQNNLGVLYKDGQGVAQDYGEAARWFALAARQGNAMAQSNLAWLYQSGLGVQRDYAMALRLYRQASAQGHAAAQNNLGTMFLHGKGLPCDTDSAVFWFERAASQGLPVASKNLQKCVRSDTL